MVVNFADVFSPHCFCNVKTMNNLSWNRLTELLFTSRLNLRYKTYFLKTL